MEKRRSRVLYISSGGIREPLIESQVVAYLRALRPILESCHLLTIERCSLRQEEVDGIRETLNDDGIAWDFISFQRSPAKLRSILCIHRGVSLAEELHKVHEFDFVHARSFLPGVIAARLKRRKRLPFLYDMRGLWAKEKQAKGTLKQEWLANLLWKVEKTLLREADEVVSLTHAGEKWLLDRGLADRVIVVPCCADLARFDVAKAGSPKPLRLISIGSLGPGYLPQAVFRVFKAAQRIDPNCELDLVSRSDLSLVQEAADKAGVDWTNRISFRSLPSSDVPEAIQEADVGLCMVEPSEAKIASSPTKLAEYLAAGKPVIACEGCGDVEDILETNNVGAIVRHDRGDHDFSAVERCIKLLNDPEFSERCRAVAESQFSLDVGVSRYSEVYSRLSGRVS